MRLEVMDDETPAPKKGFFDSRSPETIIQSWLATPTKTLVEEPRSRFLS
ncbi:hypothetical protein COSO111634_37435 [Corallococcus soli]